MTQAGERRLATLLRSGGDSRLAAHARAGLLDRPLTRAPIACFSSCTASPISPRGWRAAASLLGRIAEPQDSVALSSAKAALIADLVRLFGLAGLAEVILTGSGTDAAGLLAALLEAEQPSRVPSHVTVAAAETGSGIIEAVTPAAQYALREPDGALRPMAAVDIEVQDLCARFERPILHLVAGSKTGIEAPAEVPHGVETVVDACQGRLSPARIRGFLRRGWPVLLTGSKFHGGPPFCGAVLFPSRRLATIDLDRVPAARAPVDIGTLLRWSAALAEMRQFSVLTLEKRLAKLSSLSRDIEAGLHDLPHLVPLPAPGQQDGWPVTIHSFAVRDEAGRLMGMAALRTLQSHLAARSVLLGQPVFISRDVVALRIALGARTATALEARRQVDQLFDALSHAPARSHTTARYQVAAE